MLGRNWFVGECGREICGQDNRGPNTDMSFSNYGANKSSAIVLFGMFCKAFTCNTTMRICGLESVAHCKLAITALHCVAKRALWCCACHCAVTSVNTFESWKQVFMQLKYGPSHCYCKRKVSSALAWVGSTSPLVTAVQKSYKSCRY